MDVSVISNTYFFRKAKQVGVCMNKSLYTYYLGTLIILYCHVVLLFFVERILVSTT